MVFNTTFNNISVISWGSIVLVEETGIQEENHRPVSNHGQILPHNVTGVTSGAGTSHPSGASDFTPFSSWNSCCSIFGFCVEFDRTLFVFVYCSLWALYVLLPIEVSD
jgi:hypothetical protein